MHKQHTKASRAVMAVCVVSMTVVQSLWRLVETLAAKVDLLTAKLATLEMRIKTGECSCDTWRRHTGLPREKKD